MSNKLKQLRSLREIGVDQLLDLVALAELAESDKNRALRFQIACEELQDIFDNFEENHKLIVQEVAISKEPDFSFDKQVRSTFMENYFIVKETQIKLFPNSTSLKSENVNSQTKSNAKLPKLLIPTFDGDFRTWPTFYDMFSSLIDQNNSISNIEKFQYLIGSLKGEPLNLIKAIQVTDANYLVAIQTLTERYQNKRLMANAYWSAIYNSPKLNNDNFSSLRRLVDTFSENLAALKLLGLPVEHYDFIMYQLLIQKVDSGTVKRFELQEASSDLPSYKVLKLFLERQCTALESINASSKSSSLTKSQPCLGSKSPNKISSFMMNTSSQICSCALCKGSHLIYKCSSFLEKSPKDRYQLVNTKGWCLNCLHTGHQIQNCNSNARCRTCQGNHHTLLHGFSIATPHTSLPQLSGSSSAQTPSAEIHSLTNVIPSYMVLLSTLLVEIIDIHGNSHTIRALLDSGSQASILTQKLAKRLGLRTSNKLISVLGIGETHSQVSNIASCTIRSKYQKSFSLSFNAVVISKICSELPSRAIIGDSWPHTKNLQLADPTYNVPGSVDLLLGADVYSSVILPGLLQGGPDEPVAQNTAFGWVLLGKASCESPINNIKSLFVSSSVCLDDTLKKFWEIEDIPSYPQTSADDLHCEEYFSQTTTRNSEGRYVVVLPFKTAELPALSDSKPVAFRRFLSLENRLVKLPDIYKNYCEFMQDYLDSKHMQLAGEPPSPSQTYYIPHHSVMTPKFRVVFDASAKGDSGISLNDCLHSGPKLQKDICSILLNFRLFPVAFTADIRQMFRQISVAGCHRDYQRIFWRFSKKEPIQEYVLNTVTYGLSPSPYLALRTIQQLALDYQQDYPLASATLLSDIFVDDICVSCKTVEQASQLKFQLIELLQKACFELRKWSSNTKIILESIPLEFQQTQSLTFDHAEVPSVKVLGLTWSSLDDYFSYSFTDQEPSCTKRSILSQVAKIFDPLGYLSPVTFSFKFLIQHLWTLGLDWDDTPPPKVISHWFELKSKLSCLSCLRIPRCLVSQEALQCQLHGFSDSSEKGYAAAVYLRCEFLDGSVGVSLVCAKSKVAPLKRVSLPRLELCGAVLLSNLMEFVQSTYSDRIKITEVFAYTDSMVTLSWIKSSSYRWKCFVANRVSHIQDRVPPDRWFHVRSQDNPADYATRGLMPDLLVQAPLWWAGPTWLTQSPEHWAITTTVPTALEEETSGEERKCVFIASYEDNCLDNLMANNSSLSKIKRIMCYILRFIQNTRSPSQKRLDSFSFQDLNFSLLTLVKHVQIVFFAEEISNIRQQKRVSKSLRKLTPFIDEQGFLRVGGRLSHSSLLYDQKFPILLPRQHRLTELIIQDFHFKYLHAGVQTLQFLISQNFWICSFRRAIRHVISKCHRCFRLRPKPFQPQMGDLPSIRVIQAKAFQHVGVDFGGPFSITMSRTRGAKTLKSYLCLFICLTTKAIHLELASELTSDCFLAALRRFISRRGRCSRIYSDCGTNFIGAAKEIKRLMQSAAEAEELIWSFNPPSAPHFGGIWESGIKSVKSHLLRTVGSQILSYEEFNTLLVQVEALLNSRPICPLSTDPHDLSVLTPGHFLVLSPLSTIPEDDLHSVPLNRLDRWQLIQRINRDIWKRWHSEYLNTLSQRLKWMDNLSSAKEGAMVVLKDEQLPLLKWRYGRIERLYPGKDGVPRVADVRTSRGLFRRPLVKLCPLPVQS